MSIHGVLTDHDTPTVLRFEINAIQNYSHLLFYTFAVNFTDVHLFF
jgi:hypothetical protein